MKTKTPKQTRPATREDPGVPGWKWATGEKLTKGHRRLNQRGSIFGLDCCDMAQSHLAKPVQTGHGWCGYISPIEPKAKRAKVKGPKGRVMWGCLQNGTLHACAHTHRDFFSAEEKSLHVPGVFIPCTSKKQAAAIAACDPEELAAVAAFLRKSYAERVEEVAERIRKDYLYAVCDPSGYAKSALAAIGMKEGV